MDPCESAANYERSKHEVIRLVDEETGRDGRGRGQKLQERQVIVTFKYHI
jgi:hypothetical protein